MMDGEVRVRTLELLLRSRSVAIVLRTVAVCAAFAAVALWLPVRAAPLASPYMVNSTLDEPDSDPSKGLCSSTPSGQCTLRAAIQDANFAGGVHTITLPAG